MPTDDLRVDLPDDLTVDELPPTLGTEDPEAPEADALEQRLPLPEQSGLSAEAPFEADPADAADQQLDVGMDDDEYE
jgi:hypothetical protein